MPCQETFSAACDKWPDFETSSEHRELIAWEVVGAAGLYPTLEDVVSTVIAARLYQIVEDDLCDFADDIAEDELRDYLRERE